MKSSGKRKLSLMWTIISSLAMVGTASVATFAWFQASAAASVQTASTSVDITVSGPENIHVSNRDVYMYRGNPAGKNVTDDFTPVSTVEARTITDFYPGDKVTIAIKVTADGNISTGSMDLTYQGYSLSNRTIYGTSGGSLKVINILSAIKISAGANGTGAYPAMTEKVSPLARGNEYLLSDLTRVGSTSNYYKENTASDAISGATIGTTTGYFFYTVEFVNTVSTFYLEKDSTGSSNIPTPKNDSSTRYFTGGNNGSSTCYEGLRFDVTAANIKIG